LAQSADSRLDIWQDSQINDRGDHMSTSLPLAGELADDLLYGADAIGAYPFGREDAQRARRAGYHLVSEPIRKPNTDFPNAASGSSMLPISGKKKFIVLSQRFGNRPS
jgi:hypothetical protein